MTSTRILTVMNGNRQSNGQTDRQTDGAEDGQENIKKITEDIRKTTVVVKNKLKKKKNTVEL